MELETLSFEERLSRAAQASGLDEATFRETALHDAVRRIERKHSREAKRRADVDERLLSRLRVIVARALASAVEWTEVQARLRENGVEYVVAGGGLALARAGGGEKLCKASEVGPGYKALVRRLRAPFPGHPHVWIARSALGAMAAPEPTSEPDDALIDYGA